MVDSRTLPPARREPPLLQTEEGILIYEGTPHSQKVLYGNVIWDGALSLANLFAWNERMAQEELMAKICGKRVLELGAGTGIVGLTLGRLGAQVTLTDNEPELVELMMANVHANSLAHTVVAQHLDWEDVTTYLTEYPFDVIVAADVLYEGDGSHFAQALRAHMPHGSSTVAYVANHHNAQRCKAMLGFLGLMLRWGFRLDRLEDVQGRAVGSLWGHHGAESVFDGSHFTPVFGEADLAAVQEAKFEHTAASPMQRIQIFRLSRPLPPPHDLRSSL